MLLEIIYRKDQASDVLFMLAELNQPEVQRTRSIHEDTAGILLGISKTTMTVLQKESNRLKKTLVGIDYIYILDITGEM